MTKPDRPLVAALACCLLCACGTTASVTFQKGKPAFAPRVAACVDAAEPTEDRCWAPLLDALEAGQRGLAGEILLAVGAGNPDVMRAAGWLNPKPWARSGRPGLAALSGASVPADPEPPDAILFFGEGDPPGDVQGRPIVRVDLHIPRGEGWLAGDGLVLVLSNAAGAMAGAWQEGGKGAVRVVPAAPLFARLIGDAIPAVPGGWELCLEIAGAERSLRAGRHADAFFALRAASGREEAKQSLPHRCILSYVLWQIALLDGSLDGGDDLEAMHRECGAEETGAFLREMGYVEEHRSNLRSLSKMPIQWLAEADLARYLGRIRELARTQRPVRRALLEAAADLVRHERTSRRDACDDAREKAQRQALRGVATRFEHLGRQDLGWFRRADDLLDDRNDTIAAATRAYSKWLDEPGQAWFARRDRNESVLWLGGTSFGHERPHVGILCERSFADQLESMAQDRHAGFEKRLSAQIPAAVVRGTYCPGSTARVAAVADAVFEASIEADPGREHALRALAHTLWQLVILVVEQKPERLDIALPTLYEALAKAGAKLGQKPQDRVLAICFETIREAIALVRTGTSDLPRILERSLAELGGIAAASAGPDQPLPIRLSPGLRLALQLLRAIALALSGKGSGALAAVEEMDKSAAADLSALLKNLGTEDHSATLARMVGAARLLVGAAVSGEAPDRRKALEALRSLATPTKSENGWWAFGLEAGRLVLWDTLLVLSETGDDKDLAGEVLPVAEGITARATRSILSLLGGSGSGYELLGLLGPVHRAIVAGRRAPEGDPGTPGRVAAVFDAPLKEALARIRADPRPEGAARTFVELLHDVLREAARVGLASFASTDGARRMADALEPLVVRYDGALRAYVEMGIGVLRTIAGQDGAASFRAAAKSAASGALHDQQHLPAVLESMIRWAGGGERDGRARAERAKATLQALDEALLHGDKARSCGRYHAVHALLPVRMVLRATTGDYEGAAREHDLYSRLTGRGRPVIPAAKEPLAWTDSMRPDFTGESAATCWLETRHGSFIGNTVLSVSLSAMFLPVEKEQTFQVGLGAGTVNEGHVEERLVCTSGPVEGRRSDRIMAAHLAMAVYAFLRGDDRKAHSALMSAVDEGRLMAQSAGSAVVDPATSRGLGTSIDRADVPLLVFAATLAQLRGQYRTAALLEQIAGAVAEKKGESIRALATRGLDDPEGPLPVYLRGLDRLTPLASVVRGLLDVTAKSAGDLSKEVRSKAKGLSRGWGLAAHASWMQARVGDVDGAARLAAKLLPPADDPAGSALVRAWKIQLAFQGKGVSPGVAAAEEVVAELAAAGLHGEAGGLAVALCDTLVQQSKPAEAVALLEKAHSQIPLEGAPLVRADVDTRLAELAAAGDPARAAKLAHDALAIRHGRIGGEAELRARVAVLNLLGRTNQRQLLREQLDATLPIVRRALPQHSIRYNLEVLDVAVAGLDGHPSRDRIDTLLAQTPSANENQAALDFLRLLEKNASHAVNAGTLCEQFLAHMFTNGPAPSQP